MMKDLLGKAIPAPRWGFKIPAVRGLFGRKPRLDSDFPPGWAVFFSEGRSNGALSRIERAKLMTYTT